MKKDSLIQENKELVKLININEDACEFYESAGEKAENPQIKRTFSNLESLHKAVVNNLQRQVRANGGDPESSETVAGQAAQLWGRLMASISNDVDETLVTHLEESEDRCLHSMRDAAVDDNVTPATRKFLQTELVALQKSHDYMKALKESMKAA